MYNMKANERKIRDVFGYNPLANNKDKENFQPNHWQKKPRKVYKKTMGKKQSNLQ